MKILLLPLRILPGKEMGRKKGLILRLLLLLREKGDYDHLKMLTKGYNWGYFIVTAAKAL